MWTNNKHSNWDLIWYTEESEEEANGKKHMRLECEKELVSRFVMKFVSTFSIENKKTSECVCMTRKSVNQRMRQNEKKVNREK